MYIKEVYLEAVKGKYKSLILVIQFLVYEKKVLTFDDDLEKLNYFLQEKFRDKMNVHLREYKARIEGQKEKAVTNI